jgi:peptidoglycan/LPS O-acetylase OafA/YrhL
MRGVGLFFACAIVMVSASACSEALEELFAFRFPGSLEMVASSAHGPGSLGRYDDCETLNGTVFVMLWPNNTISRFSGAFGLCVPGSCGEDDLEALKIYARNISHLPSSTSLDVGRVEVIAPSQLPVRAIVFICFSSFLAVLALFASLSVFWKERFRAMLCRAVESKRSGFGFQFISPNKERIEEAKPLIAREEERVSDDWNAFEKIFAIQGACVELVRVDESVSMPWLNGLRLFASLSVVFANTIPMFLSSAGNLHWVDVNYHDTLMSVFRNGYVYRVDVFFMTSGMLLCLSMLRKLERNEMRWTYTFVHRILRLAPMLWYVILFKFLVLPYVISGPLVRYALIETENCGATWWNEMLFQANLYKLLGQIDDCLPNSWYLSADLQSFVWCPLIVLALYKRRVFGFVLLAVLQVFCVSYRVVSQLFPSVYWSLFNDFVSAFPVYIGGLAVGYLFHELDKKETPLAVGLFSRYILGLGAVLIWITISLIGWSIASAIESWANRLVMGLFRILWVVGFGALLFLLRLGNGGWLRALLSSSLMRPLGKLSYGAYLVHWCILRYYFASQQSLTWFSGATVVSTVLSVFVLAYLCSFCTYCIVERPCAVVESRFSARFFAAKER